MREDSKSFTKIVTVILAVVVAIVVLSAISFATVKFVVPFMVSRYERAMGSSQVPANQYYVTARSWAARFDKAMANRDMPVFISEIRVIASEAMSLRSDVVAEPAVARVAGYQLLACADALETSFDMKGDKAQGDLINIAALMCKQARAGLEWAATPPQTESVAPSPTPTP